MANTQDIITELYKAFRLINNKYYNKVKKQRGFRMNSALYFYYKLIYDSVVGSESAQ